MNRRTDTLGTLETIGPLGADNRHRQLGRSADLRALLSANQREMTLIDTSASRKERGGPSYGESLAQRVAITCDLRRLTDVADDVFQVVGKLAWGNDGHRTEVPFDWKQGTIVHPVGAAFRLSAELRPSALGTAPTIDVEVGAHIGYAGGFMPAQATLTQVQNQAVSTDFEVPPHAQNVAVYLQGGNFSLTWFVGATALTVSNALTSKGQMLAVPGGGVTMVRVLGAFAASNIMLVWGLAI